MRRLGPDDWEISRQVRLTALAEAPYAFMSTLDREQRIRRAGLAAAARVADGCDVPGLGGRRARWHRDGKVDDPDDEFAVPGAWQLVGMWVDPAARGIGVADMLIGAVA